MLCWLYTPTVCLSSSFPFPLPSISLQISVASPLQLDVDTPLCSPSMRWTSSELLCHCGCACVCVDIAPSSPCLEWAQNTKPGTFFLPPTNGSPMASHVHCPFWWHYFPWLLADLTIPATFHAKTGLFVHKGLVHYLQQRKRKNWVANLFSTCNSSNTTPSFMFNDLLFAGVYKEQYKPPVWGLFHLLCIHRLFCFGLLWLWEMSAVVSLERMHLMMLVICAHRDIQRSTH